MSLVRSCFPALSVALVGALALIPVSAPAQSFDYDQGLGVGLQSQVLTGGLNSIQTIVPVAYFVGVSGDRYMFEPSVSYARVSESQDVGGGTRTMVSSQLRVGFGFLLLSERGDAGRSYWGPRLGLGRSATSQGGTGIPDSDNERYDLSAALVTGGELLTEAGFGIGGEVGLEYRRWGGTETDPDRSMSRISVLAELRMRWYLR